MESSRIVTVTKHTTHHQYRGERISYTEYVSKAVYEKSSGPLYVHRFRVLDNQKRVTFFRVHRIISNGRPDEDDYVPLGQVQSHRTGNTGARTNAHAGGNITTINYYGSQSAAAWNPSAASMDPGQFTKPLADVMKASSGPALKSPTVEECGYSDRIMQLTSGNSTITTQEAAGAVVGYARWPDYYDAAGEAIDMTTKPGVSCDRFYTFDSIDWTKTSRAWVMKFPEALKDYGVFGQNLVYHYLYRSGFCVHIQCNASKFHQGALLCAMVPEFVTRWDSGAFYEIDNWADWPTEWPIGQLTLAPHQIINLRTNNAATILYPYTNPTPASFGLSHNHVSLVIVALVPLDYSPGASPNIPITISVAPMCSQFSGLRNSLAAQGVPTFTIPGSGQFISTLRNSGFPLYPEFDEVKAFENPGMVRNLLEVAQVGTFIDFAQTANGFVYTIDVNNTKKTEALFHWDMSFMTSNFLTTYLCRLARMFNTYRGSVNFEFMFCGSAMATGKLLLAYTPPGGDRPDSRKAAMLGTSLVWDIGLQSTIKFTVPYISTSQFRYNAIDTNTLSLDGFISMFYQTLIVVPPGAPSTCQIVCKLSAASNFIFRVPTDDAYFQGLGDELQNAIQDMTKDALQMVPANAVPAVTGGNKPGLALTNGDSPALTAAETGTSSSADGAGMMEVREIDVTFSAAETDIEYFFSRYFHQGLMYLAKAGAWSPAGTPATEKKMDHIVLGMRQTMSNNPSLWTKFKMFTYWKFDLDVVIVPSLVKNADSGTFQAVYQFLFIPYGNSLPANENSNLWNTTANPLVTWIQGNPPPSFRLPFLSSASCFAPQYDGFGKFGDKAADDYNFFPGNYYGTLFVRSLGPVNDMYKMSFDVFVRPVNVSAYMPRPIVKYGNNTRAESRSRHRAVFVDDADTDYMPLGVKQYTPYELVEDPFTPMDSWTERLYQSCFPVITGSGTFTMWRVNTNHFILPMHANPENGLEVYVLAGPYYDWLSETPVKLQPRCIRASRELDLVTFKLDGIRDGPGILPFIPEIAPDKIECLQNIFVCSPDFPNVLGNTDAGCVLQTEYRCNGNLQGPAYKTAYNARHGHCGGLLHAKSTIRGILVAGKPGQGIGMFSILTRSLFKSSGSFKHFLPKPPIRVVSEFLPLGPIDWMKGVTADLGKSMGFGFTNEVHMQMDPIMRRLERSAKNTLDETVTSFIFKAVLKVVCGVALMMNSYDRTSSLIALCGLVGADFITTDPFHWLKGFVQEWADGTIRAQGPSEEKEEQGPIDWMKDFNAACNAAKGLDWLVARVTQFFDWLSSFFKKVEPKKRRFLKLMDQWPSMMAEFDEMETDPRSFTDVKRLQLCEKIQNLKELCDIYGVERNFSTSQVIRYAAKARKVVQNMRTTRHEPVALCIHGGPGTGKSLATEIIGRALSNHYDKQTPYSLPPDPKHFDGYEQQDVVLMDDVGQNPDGQDLSLFCQMVSSTSFIPPMADLDDKGKPFTSKFVLCSSNLEDLKPPTVSEPKALARRFFLDSDIKVGKAFQDKHGRLNLELASKPCAGCSKPDNFKSCKPLLCGRAIVLKDRTDGNEYSLDKVVTMFKAEQQRRARCTNVIDGIFQGPPTRKVSSAFEDDDCAMEYVDGNLRKVTRKQLAARRDPEEWLMSDWDVETASTSSDFSSMSCEPAPQVLIDLISSVKDEKIIDWCIANGYAVPAKVAAQVEREKVSFLTKHWNSILSALGFLTSCSILVILLVKLVGTFQGPYEGAGKATKLKKPEPRKVEVQGPDVEFANSLLKRSLLRVVTEKGPFTGLALYDNVFIIPAHAVIGEKVMIDDEMYPVTDQYELVTAKGPTEVLVVTVERTEKWKDLRKFLPENICTEKGCWLVMNSDLYPRMLFPVGTVSPFGNINLSSRGVSNVMCYGYPTKTGQCGGVIVKAGKIMGIHIGGDGLNGYCAALKRSYFAAKQGQIVAERKAKKTIHLNTKSRLFPSVFHDVFPGSKEPAPLHFADPRLEVNFEEALFSKYKGNTDSVPEELMIAVDHYTEQIRPLMPENLAEPLTLEEVVYGTENLEGLDLNTSAGYPYVTMGIRKKDLISEDRDLTRLREALDLHGYGHPYVTYLKDELRPIEKIKAGKTRLIEASSMNDTIRMKMQYGRLFQVFHSNPGTVTGSAVGCNPDLDWTRFYNEIGEENVLCFDYKNFDASLSPFWFDGLKLVLFKLGLNPDLVDGVCNSTHIFRNREYDVVGGMPSGCSGTSIFNSIINNLILRVLALKAYKGIDLDHLRIIAYGDDVIASYPFPLDPKLFSDHGKKLGLTITPADKSEEFKGVQNITEVTFLKRGFKPDEQFPFLIHPTFPWEEIYESIRWTRSASTTQEHVRSLLELAWHSGEGEYDDFVEKIRGVPVGRALTIPAYSYFRNKWLESF